MLCTRMDECRFEKVLRDIVSDITLEAVARSAFDSWQQISKAEEWFRSLSEELFIKSVACAGTGETNAHLYPQLTGLIREMQSKRKKRDMLSENATRIPPIRHSFPITFTLEEAEDPERQDVQEKIQIDQGKEDADDDDEEDVTILRVALLPKLMCRSKSSRHRKENAITSAKAVTNFEDNFWAPVRSVLRAEQYDPQLHLSLLRQSLLLKKFRNGKVTCVAISNDGSCIACGSAGGVVLVWALSLEETQIGKQPIIQIDLLCCWKPRSAAESFPIKCMQFGLSRAGIEILTLDERNIARVLHLRAPTAKMEKLATLGKQMTQTVTIAKSTKSKGRKKRNNTKGTMVLEERLLLQSVDFARPRTEGELDVERAEMRDKRRGNFWGNMFGARKKEVEILQDRLIPDSQYERSLRPVYASFHPKTDPSLLMQPSIVVALANSTIAKWNQPPVRGAWDIEDGILDSEQWVSAALSEPPNPYWVPSAGDSVTSVKNGDEGSAMTPRLSKRIKGDGKIEREFFAGHGDDIRYVGFFTSSNESDIFMCSVDWNCNILIWPYSPDNFSGFGWFEPNARMRLDCRLAEFAVSPNGERKRIFPPENTAIPESPSQDPNFVRLARSEEKNIDSLDINPEPWNVVSDERDGSTISTYAPINFSENEVSKHHILRHDNDGLLLEHWTELHEKNVRNGVVAGCQVLDCTRELAVLCVYPESELVTKKSVRNVVIKARLYLISLDRQLLCRVCFCLDVLIPLTTYREYSSAMSSTSISTKPRAIPFAISRVVDTVGCDYLFVANGGCVSVYSLGTGTMVHEGIRPKNVTAKAKPTSFTSLPPITHLVVCSAADGRPKLLGYVEDIDVLAVFDFTDFDVLESLGSDKNESLVTRPRWRCVWNDFGFSMRARSLVLQIVEGAMSISEQRYDGNDD